MDTATTDKTKFQAVCCQQGHDTIEEARMHIMLGSYNDYTTIIATTSTGSYKGVITRVVRYVCCGRQHLTKTDAEKCIKHIMRQRPLNASVKHSIKLIR